MAMQPIKISDLPKATSAAQTDGLVIDQTDATRVIRVDQFIQSSGVLSQTDLDGLVTKEDLSSSSGASNVGTSVSGESVQQALTSLSNDIANVSLDLASATGASKVGTTQGTVEERFGSVEGGIETLKDSGSYLQELSVSRSHKYKILHEVTHQFQGYADVLSSGGYNYLYATGHTFDHQANELWIAYQADGGDAAQWYVIYDLETMSQKTYFKCGVRWTKTFNLHYKNGSRLLYGRGTNSYLAIFDVTMLPAQGSTILQQSQPKSNIGALFSSVMGDQILVAHRGQTTNTVTQFNTYLVLDPVTFEHKRVYRMNTVAAGDTDGNSTTLYKTQGLTFVPSGVAIAHGGFVSATESGTKPVSVDYRSIQGVIVHSPEGVPQLAGLFDPFKAISVFSALGYVVNRFETEGLNYDEKTNQLTTIWHLNGNADSKFLIVEAFSSDENAIDLASCAVGLLPNVPEIMSLYRDDQNGTQPHDPVTGVVMGDVSDLCQMMTRYDMRSLSWYTTNFSALTFNGSTMVGSMQAELFRGTNTTFFLVLTGAGAAQKWLVQVSGTTYTYTLMATFSNAYRFSTTVGMFYGTGSPEGALTASPGSTYQRTDGGASTSFYVKETGTGNTGWVAK